jgi:hypothetical protein
VLGSATVNAGIVVVSVTSLSLTSPLEKELSLSLSVVSTGVVRREMSERRELAVLAREYAVGIPTQYCFLYCTV